MLQTWPFLSFAGLCLAASFFLTGHGCGVEGMRRCFWTDPALLTVFVCGLPLLREALEALFERRRIVSPLLISIAMVACLSIGQVFAAGEIAFIMALGEMLEERTLDRAKKGLSKLVSLAPETAHRVTGRTDGQEQGGVCVDVPVETVAPGDVVRVLPGETVPVDGIVADGVTTVDQSVMTGESLPVDKREGDAVYSGTVNRFGAIDVRVTKSGTDSSLQKMIRLVKEAETKKAPLQRIADKWASVLVPVSMAVALLTFLGVWWCCANGFAAVPAGSTALMTGLIRGVTILVVFCPCALALATPTSVMAAIGQATKHGVIVKSGEALEKMGGVRVICLDKTGTLTTGRLSVKSVVSFAERFSEADVLRLAAAVEAYSEHPLAKAMVEESRQRGQGDEWNVQSFAMSPGRGVRGVVDGMSVVCGTEAWLRENGIGTESEDPRVPETAVRLRREGDAVVLVAVDGAAAGLVALADTPRAEAKKAIDGLVAAGVSPWLLTGDHAATAEAVAHELGLTEVRAELLPGQKASVIEEIEKGGRPVCMVGDGVNDAVALETACVGVAMGGAGSDIAVDAADIALVGDDLTKLAYLKRLSTACVRLIKTNIALALGINAAAVALSALGLLTPVSGALVHNAGSLLVILNAALLYDRKL